MRRSFGGAFGVSAVTHAAVFLMILFITGRMPDPTSSQQARSNESGSVVWMPQSEPGEGVGGGGQRTPEPPRRAEAPGVDRTTVRPRFAPTPQPHSVVTPSAEPEPALQIEALPTAAGIAEMPGIIAILPSVSGSLGPGSGGGAGHGRGGGDGPDVGPGFGPGPERGGGFPLPGANGVTFPRLIREVTPTYTDGALRARVQGFVALQAVVHADGSVGDVWITRSLDRTFGIDDEAVRTVKRWRFVPATQNGKPVAVVVPIELRFTIR